MEIKTWKQGMSDAETKDIAYWERNMLALYLADGWYYDDIEAEPYYCDETGQMAERWAPRYKGWHRVLSCFGGAACFHIPDDFDVMNLPQIDRNWDGHSTPEKWERLAERIKDGAVPNPDSRRLTRAEVSEAISLCYQYGNEAIVNYLFGMRSAIGKPDSENEGVRSNFPE